MFSFLRKKPLNVEKVMAISPPVDKLLTLFKEDPNRLKFQNTSHRLSGTYDAVDTVTKKRFSFNVHYTYDGTEIVSFDTPSFLNEGEKSELASVIVAAFHSQLAEKERALDKRRKAAADKERKDWIEVYVND